MSDGSPRDDPDREEGHREGGWGDASRGDGGDAGRDDRREAERGDRRDDGLDDGRPDDGWGVARSGDPGTTANASDADAEDEEPSLAAILGASEDDEERRRELVPEQVRLEHAAFVVVGVLFSLFVLYRAWAVVAAFLG